MILYFSIIFNLTMTFFICLSSWSHIVIHHQHQLSLIVKEIGICPNCRQFYLIVINWNFISEFNSKNWSHKVFDLISYIYIFIIFSLFVSLLILMQNAFLSLWSHGNLPKRKIMLLNIDLFLLYFYYYSMPKSTQWSSLRKRRKKIIGTKIS